MRTWISIVGSACGVLVLGSGAFMLVRPRIQSVPSVPATPESSIHSARDARVAALESEVANLRASLSELRLPDRAPEPSGLAPAAATDLPSGQDQVRALERRFREPEDPSWARRAERDLLDVYLPLLTRDPGLRLVDARCRKTLCRVEWSVPEESDAAALRDVPWDGSSLLVQTLRDDGTSSLVAYIDRAEDN